MATFSWPAVLVLNQRSVEEFVAREGEYWQSRTTGAPTEASSAVSTGAFSAVSTLLEDW